MEQEHKPTTAQGVTARFGAIYKANKVEVGFYDDGTWIATGMIESDIVRLDSRRRDQSVEGRIPVIVHTKHLEVASGCKMFGSGLEPLRNPITKRFVSREPSKSGRMLGFATGELYPVGMEEVSQYLGR